MKILLFIAGVATWLGASVIIAKNKEKKNREKIEKTPEMILHKNLDGMFTEEELSIYSCNVLVNRRGERIRNIEVYSEEIESGSNYSEISFFMKMMKAFSVDEYFMNVDRILFKFYKKRKHQDDNITDVLTVSKLFSVEDLKAIGWDHVNSTDIFKLGEETCI